MRFCFFIPWFILEDSKPSVKSKQQHKKLIYGLVMKGLKWNERTNFHLQEEQFPDYEDFSSVLVVQRGYGMINMW